MEPAQTRARSQQPAPTFEDGFGKRQHVVSATKDPVEVLVLKREHIAVPGFEAAVRERVDQVSRFHHEGFSRVRGLARLAKTDSGVALVSDRVEGPRLSYLLDPAQQRSLEMNGALMLVGQLVDALAAFHAAVPGSHGAIGPERLILTSTGKLVVVDHVFSTALSKLSLSPTELWEQLRVAVAPESAPVFDPQTDLLQAGSVALALMLGRPLGDGYPNRIGEKGATALSVSAALELVPEDIANWISRAIHRRGHEPFQSSAAARDALAPILATLDRVAARNAVISFQSGEIVDVPPVVRPLVSTSAPVPVPLPSPPAPKPLPIEDAPVAAAPRVIEPQPLVDEPEADADPDTDAVEEEARPSMAFAASSAAISAGRRFLVPMTRQTIGIAAAILMLLTTGGAFAAKRYFSPPSSATVTKGTLAVTTTPAGASVVIDGQQRGRAPMTLELAAGEHVLMVGLDGSSRTIPFTVTPGAQVSQVIDLPKLPPPTGQLQIRTEPSGARVLVDGQKRGNSPLTIEGLTPGSHMVTVEGQIGSVTQDVSITSGVTAALVVPLNAPPAPPTSGWISVNSPIDVQLFENGQQIGTNRSSRITASAGKHELELGNDALGLRVSRTVNVTAGQVAIVKLDPPKGSISLNAVPWAEVWIDGERVGETPIGNVQVAIGQHDVLFRHPELGEQRFTPTVTLSAPARLSADLRRKP